MLILKSLSTNYVYTLKNANAMCLKIDWKNVEDVLLNVLVNKTVITCLIVFVVGELFLSVLFYCLVSLKFQNLACMLFSQSHY